VTRRGNGHQAVMHIMFADQRPLHLADLKLNADASQWEVLFDGEKVGEVKWALVGEHNMHNLQQPIAITCFRLMSFSGRIILPLPGTMRTRWWNCF
jgi:UDP-N-acetylmuramate-alanine ligase